MYIKFSWFDCSKLKHVILTQSDVYYIYYVLIIINAYFEKAEQLSSYKKSIKRFINLEIVSLLYPSVDHDHMFILYVL